MNILKYYIELKRLVNMYGTKYSESPRKTAFRKIYWNARALFYRCKGTPYPCSIPSDRLRIGFRIVGGLGDFLLNCNYLHYLREYIKDSPFQIDLWVEPKRVQMARYFTNQPVFADLGYKDYSQYDLFIRLCRLPEVTHANQRRIRSYSEKLADLVDFYLSRKKDLQIPHICRVFKNVSMGIKRYQEADLGALLNIEEEYREEIPLPENREERFKALGVAEKFMTLSRSTDVTHRLSTTARGTKLWPQERYEELIPLLKKDFPQYQLVQLGASLDRSPKMKGIDLCLVGKTSFDDLKILLKDSACHIDGEGGFVHLRHALHGKPSVVIFGPTSWEYYGYSENINLHSDQCYSCEGIRKRWYQQCPRGDYPPPCLGGITPENVLVAVHQLIQ